MNNLMDRIGAEIFDGVEPRVSFSYFEMLGAVCTDCLVEEQPPKGVQIGENVDGSMIVKGLSSHLVHMQEYKYYGTNISS